MKSPDGIPYMNLPRLKEVISWLRDDEVYTVYYDGLAVRMTPALRDCLQLTLHHIESKKQIRYVLLPEEKELFSVVINRKLTELIEEVEGEGSD